MTFQNLEQHDSGYMGYDATNKRCYVCNREDIWKADANFDLYKITRSDITPVQRSIQQKDGTCLACEDYKKASADERTCVSDTCIGRQILDMDGSCKNCVPYTRPAPDGKSCMAEACAATKKLTIEGYCEACPEYTRKSADGRLCESFECPNAREKHMPDGTCQECGDYQTRDPKDSKACITVVGNANPSTKPSNPAMPNEEKDVLSTLKTCGPA